MWLLTQNRLSQFFASIWLAANFCGFFGGDFVAFSWHFSYTGIVPRKLSLVNNHCILAPLLFCCRNYVVTGSVLLLQWVFQWCACVLYFSSVYKLISFSFFVCQNNKVMLISVRIIEIWNSLPELVVNLYWNATPLKFFWKENCYL